MKQTAMFATLLATSAIALPLSAQTLGVRPTWESPITGFAELHYGRYAPNIDEGTSGPFQQYFGEDLGSQLELEYDHYLYDGIGAAGVAFNAGYATQSVEAFVTGSDTERAADETSLSLLPLRLSAVYRFDYLQDRWGVPVTFALQPGVSVVNWWVRAGGEGTEVDGNQGRGVTHGLHFAAGAYFLLDFLAPGMGRSFDANVGVNHSYIFVEWMTTKLNDFGSDESWDLSDTDRWSGGLAFEF